MTAIALTGPMGAGKSSVGRRVARSLGVTFADTDKLIAAEHGPIPELFAAHGEARFRELERRAVSDALQSGGVVALGGGAVLDPGTREALRHHRVALLTVSPSVVHRRLGAGNRPLLAGGEDPVERWNRIWTERRGVYEEAADAVFDTSHRPLSQIADEIVAWSRTASPRVPAVTP